MGQVRIRGSVALQQFWPQGTSDADTVQVQVTEIHFARDGVHFKPTRAFNQAVVRGAVRKAVMHKGKVTIRLQGIDAPELHYRAAPLPRKGDIYTENQREQFNALNPERRQRWGESAAVALGKMLLPLAKQGEVACEVFSRVDEPGDLIDTYGRVVADIQVRSRNLNQWLIAHGWAVPTFYTSMTQEEIETLLQGATRGMRSGRVWQELHGDATKFENKLLFRRPSKELQLAPDEGPLLMPKLYRRQVTWRVMRAAGLYRGNLHDYLQLHPDECMLRDDFLKNGVHSARTRYLHEFVRGNKFSLQPQDLVFKEKPAEIVDAKGKPILKF